MRSRNIVETQDFCYNGCRNLDDGKRDGKPMNISYQPLWNTLKERGMRKEDLRLAAGLTTNMIANMGKGEHIHNCLTVFQHDPELSGAVAKNLLTERIDLLKPIGRKRRTGSKAMTDTDMKYIRLYLEKTYGLTSEKKIADAADLAADANSYHPIRDYRHGRFRRHTSRRQPERRGNHRRNQH